MNFRNFFIFFISFLGVSHLSQADFQPPVMVYTNSDAAAAYAIVVGIGYAGYGIYKLGKITVDAIKKEAKTIEALVLNKADETIYFTMKSIGHCADICGGKSAHPGPPCSVTSTCCASGVIDGKTVVKLKKPEKGAILFAYPKSGGEYRTKVSDKWAAIAFPDDFKQTKSIKDCSGSWNKWPAQKQADVQPAK